MIVSVIIPVYNREQYIARCLESLASQDFADFEILVVDDGSIDQTKNILSQYESDRIKIFYNNKNLGPSFCRNIAAQHALGAILAFTDSDCVADPRWLREIVAPFSRNPDIVIVGGKVEDPAPENYWQKVNFQGDFISSREGFVSKVIGCNMAVRKDFLKENAFDKSIYPAEELDLCLRARHQKKKVYYTPMAKVLHYRRDSFYSTVKQQFNYGCYNTIINLKNRQFPFVSLGLLVLIASLLLFVVQQGRLALVFFAFYVAIILYILVFQKRAIWKTTIISFPGFFILCLINSTGSLAGVLKGINIFLKHHETH